MPDAEEPGAAAVDEQRPDGRQLRWARHNHERRTRIVDAAIEVITEQGYGPELHVQQIAQRAGLSRTVVYRHFEDRSDLDVAIRAAIIDRLWAHLQPQVRLEGTIPEIIQRIVGTYVQWAVQHPALHRMADYDTAPDGPLEKALEQIASEVAVIIGVGLVGLGAHPTPEQAAGLDPLVYGLVGAVFSAVRRWLMRPEPTLTAEMLVTMTSQTVWFVIDGHARELGVTIDPDRDVDELLAAAGVGVLPG